MAEGQGRGILIGLGVVLGGILLLAIMVGVFIAGTYNRFVKMDLNVKTAWSQVENQLQRRSDLIPNLVQTVKGFAKQEKTIFVDIANARAKLAGSTTVSEKMSAANDVTSTLSRLLVIVENYPQLKSDQNFRQLMDELAGTENRLSVERMRYNETVKEYNQSLRVFPGRIIASMFNFKEAALFEAAATAKEAPKVSFE
jgi:LemA protein